MKLLAISVALPQTIDVAGKAVSTGIFKMPVTGRVQVGMLGLAGDGQADPANHGGIHKAVYSYPFEHYVHWSRELGRGDFVFGQFGENLTVAGITEDEAHIGDVFRIGAVLLQVTQPRVPCFKLAARLGRPDFPKAFAVSGRTGFYQRVLAGGEIGAGDAMERVETDPRRVTVREMMNLMHFEQGDDRLLERALAIPALTPSWRDKLAARAARDDSRMKTA